MKIKPSIILLTTLVGFNSYYTNALANDVNAEATSSVTNSTETITAKSDLIIVKFRDASYIKVLTAYHRSQTRGDYISDEQYSQARTLLQTLSNTYGAELSIARIARLGAVVLKLNEQVELNALNQRLDSTLNTLSIINYAEADPYLSVNALQSLEDGFNNAVTSERIERVNSSSSSQVFTPTNSPYWAEVEPVQEDLALPQVASWGYQRVQADQLSDAAADNLTVCIIDSGYDTSHEDLPHDRVTGTDTEVLGAWNNDEQGHGTHIAGIIAALDNQYGTKGVLPNGKVNLHIKRVLDKNNNFLAPSGYSAMSFLADNAYDCAEEGANIISISIKGPSNTYTQYGEEVFQAVYDKNVLVVAANGNQGHVAPTEEKIYPASFSSIIATGSININDEISSFSNQLAETELVAPGGGIYSTMPIGKEYFKNYAAELRINGELYPYSITSGYLLAPITAKLSYCDKENPCLPEQVKDTICIALVNWYHCNGIGLDSLYTLMLSDFESDTYTSGTSNYLSTLSVSYLDQLKTLVGQTVTLEIETKGTDGYSYANGTSMATPYVAGAAALAWSNNLKCTAAEVRAALSASAKDLGVEGWDPVYGHGLVQAKDASDYMAEHCAAYNTVNTVITYPAGDTYVRDGSYGDTNFGLAENLTVKSIYDSTEFKRKTFVKFDNSAYDDLVIQNATLRFYVSSVNTDPTRTIHFYDTTATWDEMSLTWNNAPSTNELVGTVEVLNTTGPDYEEDTSGTWYELDITDYLKEHKDEPAVAFILQNESTSSLGKSNFDIASKESAYPMEIIVNRAN
ncbi:S8 family serine peptidase [Colwellia sp. RE-S-Sl-9]